MPSLYFQKSKGADCRVPLIDKAIIKQFPPARNFEPKQISISLSSSISLREDLVVHAAS